MSSKEFKIVLAGAFGSGRSTFVAQLTDAKNAKKKIPSLRAEVLPLKLHTSAGAVTLQFYDTTLHAKGGLPAQDFFRQADAALLFYDITSQASYDALEAWAAEVYACNARRGSEPLPVIVAGTKADLLTDRAVPSKDVEFPRAKKLPYIEISSKANYRVNDLLLGLCKALLGQGTQLTDRIALEEATVAVDEEAADAARKEYASAK
ncbi:unnamed protein product [Discula destructiva]